MQAFRAFNCGYALSKDDTFDTHQQNLVWQLLGDTPITTQSIVVDVGCAIGGPLGWVIDRYHPRRAFGIEYSDFNVRNARQIWRNQSASPRFIQADAQRLPIASASVDVLINLESALHYPDKPAFLAECRRVLRPGGWLCLGDITARLFPPVGMLAGVFQEGVHLYRPGQYEKAFRKAGFDVVRHQNATGNVARSLNWSLRKVEKLPREEWAGVRTRVRYLRMLQTCFFFRWLGYDLYAARPV